MKKTLALFATVLAAVLNAATPSTSLVYKNTTTNALTGNIVAGNNTTISASGNGTITATALTGNITGNPTVSGNLTVSGSTISLPSTSGNVDLFGRLFALNVSNETRLYAGSSGISLYDHIGSGRLAQFTQSLLTLDKDTTVGGNLTVSGGQALTVGSSANYSLWKDGTPTKAGRVVLNNTVTNGLSLGLYDGSSWVDTLHIHPTNNNVLIGTTTDGGQKLQVAGAIAATTGAANNALVARYNSSNSLFGVTVNSAGQGVVSENTDVSTGSDKYSKTGLPAFRLGNTGGSGTVPFWIDVAASGTSGNAITWTNAFQIDASQNATFAKQVYLNTSSPPAWDPLSFNVMVAGSNAFGGTNSGSNNLIVASNTYFNGSVFKYATTGYATAYRQLVGEHYFYVAASGTAGDTTSLTTALTIKQGGTLQLNQYGAGALTTDSSGNVTATSDERAKNITGTFTKGLAEVVKLTPKTYTWKPETGLNTTDEVASLTAQDLIAAGIPEAVSTYRTVADVNDDGTPKLDADGKPVTKRLDATYTVSDRTVIAALVNAVKELKAEVDALKASRN